jgi:hypothetical protein
MIKGVQRISFSIFTPLLLGLPWLLFLSPKLCDKLIILGENRNNRDVVCTNDKPSMNQRKAYTHIFWRASAAFHHPSAVVFLRYGVFQCRTYQWGQSRMSDNLNVG